MTQEQISPEQHPTTQKPSNLPLLVAVGLIMVFAIGLVIWQTRSPDEAEQASVPVELSLDGPAVIAPQSELLTAATGAPLNAGETPPDFAFTLADGTTQRLSDLQGQKVIINFWATWCAPCRAEMPAIQAVRESNDEVEVLAINRGEDLPKVVAFADELSLTIPLVVDNSDDVGDAYAARGLPLTYFINTDGTVHLRHTGIMDQEFIEERIEEMQ